MTYGFGMTALRQDLLAPGLATFLLVLMCYIAGRVHQFFKQTVEREQSYREGYNQATKSLFSLATRATKGQVPVGGRTQPKTVVPMKGYASVPADVRSPLPARHRAAGRRKAGLADTKRLGGAQPTDLSNAA